MAKSEEELRQRDVEIRKLVMKIQEQVRDLTHEILDLMAIEPDELLAEYERSQKEEE